MSTRRYNFSGQPLNPGSNLTFHINYPEQPGREECGYLEGTLLYISTSRYDLDWNSCTHCHAFSELFVVTGGRGLLVSGDQSFPVSRNDLIIVNPYVDHAEFSQQEDPLEYIVLGIEGLRFVGEDRMQRQELPVVYIPDTYPQLASYMQLLLEEVQHGYEGSQMVCQHLLNIIFIVIKRHKEVNFTISSSKPVNAATSNIKDYIDTHFKEPVSLDDLAEVAHQNKYYLVHTYKAAFGMSPIRYMMNRRTEESMYLLTDTNTPIAEIGSQVGFSSSSHFTQVFKRIVGCTPTEYRRQSRERRQNARTGTD